MSATNEYTHITECVQCLFFLFFFNQCKFHCCGTIEGIGLGSYGIMDDSGGR